MLYLEEIKVCLMEYFMEYFITETNWIFGFNYYKVKQSLINNLEWFYNTYHKLFYVICNRLF